MGVTPSLSDFRKDPALTSRALSLLSDPAMRVMLDVVRDHSPIYVVPLAQGATPTDVAMVLGMEKGFRSALDILQSLAEQTVPEMKEEEQFLDDYADVFGKDKLGT